MLPAGSAGWLHGVLHRPQSGWPGQQDEQQAHLPLVWQSRRAIPSPCSSIKLSAVSLTSGWAAEDRVGRAPALCLVSAGRGSPSVLFYVLK